MRRIYSKILFMILFLFVSTKRALAGQDLNLDLIMTDQTMGLVAPEPTLSRVVTTVLAGPLTVLAIVSLIVSVLIRIKKGRLQNYLPFLVIAVISAIAVGAEKYVFAAYSPWEIDRAFGDYWWAVLAIPVILYLAFGVLCVKSFMAWRKKKVFQTLKKVAAQETTPPEEKINEAAAESTGEPPEISSREQQ